MPTLSFQNPLPDLAFAKPKALRLGSATYETPAWAKVLKEAARAMLDGAKTRKAALAAAKRLPWMGRSGRGMARPCELEPSVWIELHQGSHGILVRTKMLLESCGFPLDRAVLEYENASNGKAETGRIARKARPSDDPPPAEPVQPALFGPSAAGQPSLFPAKHSKEPSSPNQTGERTKPISFVNNMKRFLDDIREHWPDGFDFSDGALRLLEGRCGPLSGEMKKRLKSVMFRRRDKLWFPADAVAPSSLRKEAVSRAKELLSEWGFFSTVVVADLFDTPDVHLRDDRDREDFLAFLIPDNDGYLRLDQGAVQIVIPCKGHKGDSIQQAVDEFDCVASNYVQRVRAFIEEAGGTTSYEDIHTTFPNLGEDSLLDLLADKAPDIVPEANDNGEFAGFKLLSEYYLPDDIAPVLLSVLERGEKVGKVLSSSFINTELGVHYGCDFATDYALDPAYSLKWALEAVYRALPDEPSRQWSGKGAGARFIRTDDDGQPPASDGTDENEPTGGRESKWQEKYRIVRERFPGIVNLDEYADFFVKSFGLQRFTAWAHAPYFFVRLDDDRAVTVESFKAKSSWSETDGAALEAALRDRLGNAPFLPLASLPDSFFDQLPEVSFNGTRLRWTHWLLEGIVWHFAPSIRRANYGWQSFVATYVMPDSAFAADEPDFNSADYALGVYCTRNPHNRSVDAAFEFLRENHVRFRLRASLRRQIEAFLAKAEREGR